MHRIWKALRDRRGFTLIEIAIVIAIIGILLLIALPLFSGARVRAYVAEARQISSEWKALAWSCLVEKNFKEDKCDSNAKIGWEAPPTSDAWEWGGTEFACGVSAAITYTALGTACPGAVNDTTADSYFALYVPTTTDVTGLDDDYALVLRTNTGITQESPANGEDVPAP
ncbi:MAG: prepilin-type N-terminal cleavage/methylation domain-containing protein [bacterium]